MKSCQCSSLGCFLVEVAVDHGSGVRVGWAVCLKPTKPEGLVSYPTHLSLADPGSVACYRVTS